MKLSDTTSAFVGILCFSILIFSICNMFALVMSYRQKNRKQTLSCMGLFLSGLVFCDILKDVIEYLEFGKGNQRILFYVNRSVWIYVLLFLLWVACVLRNLFYATKWNREHVSADSVKESLDHLPTGIAIYRGDGSCLLVNEKMNELSVALMGHAVMNGKELEEKTNLSEPAIDILGKKYVFHHNEILRPTATIHELIADDVTDLYEKTEELKKRNHEMSILAMKMKQYSNTIDDTVRKQEILQAKVNIHDEMNRLLLATGYATGGEVSRDEVKKMLRTWQNNALLLCREADKKPQSNMVSDIETLAKMIGMDVKWGSFPEISSLELRKLFDKMTREIMMNAAKHGKAKQIQIQGEETKEEWIFTYENDGEFTGEQIVFGGGLLNLQNHLQELHGSIEVIGTPRFTVVVRIPVGGYRNGI